MTATPVSGNYTINGTSYTAAQVGSLTGEATWNPVDPYLGIGFGNPFRGSHWTFGLDLGVVYEGSAKVSLSATGAAALPQLASDVQSEQTQAQDTISRYSKWYPVLMVSLGYRF